MTKHIRERIVAPCLGVLSCLLFCLNGELLQALQLAGEGTRVSPLLNMTLCHMGGLLLLPWLPRWPAQRIVGVSQSAQTLWLPLLFSFILTAYNYCWLLSTRYQHVGLTTGLFQTSVAFVYLCSVMIFREELSGVRIIGVFFALVGSGLSCSNAAVGSTSYGGSLGVGVALALSASIGYTVYQVLFRHLFGHMKSNVSFLIHFYAMVGVVHMSVMMPLVYMAHVSGLEPLETPNGLVPWLGVLASALIASAVNGLFLCIIIWGSPMLLPCTSALSVPLTVALDAKLHGLRPSGMESVGHLLVTMSIVLIIGGPALCQWIRGRPADSAALDV
uniref:EamA domain-containing protein n=1 Tax=Noctiluca scintillans TaxID=2966 RepID=A0A7S0ZYX4_NOCSC